jgi:hypothetical protein
VDERVRVLWGEDEEREKWYKATVSQVGSKRIEVVFKVDRTTERIARTDLEVRVRRKPWKARAERDNSGSPELKIGGLVAKNSSPARGSKNLALRDSSSDGTAEGDEGSASAFQQQDEESPCRPKRRRSTGSLVRALLQGPGAAKRSRLARFSEGSSSD